MPYTYNGSDWKGMAYSSLGAQAPYVISQLEALNPNYDWSGAIQQASNLLTGTYPDMGWQDPGRGTPSGVVGAVLNASTGDPNSPVNARKEVTNYYATKQQQEADQIQAEQATHGSEGLFGDLGPLAQLAALIPGPQQPFLLAANAANSLSQGNLIGAGLNAFGAYGGGWDGLMGGSGGTTAFNGGIDQGALGQILGTNSPAAAVAGATGGVDLSSLYGESVNPSGFNPGSNSAQIADAGSSAGSWEGATQVGNTSNLGWEGDYPTNTAPSFGSTPVEIQPGFNPNNIAGTPSYSESLGSALRNPAGLGAAGTGLLSQIGTSITGNAGDVGSSLNGNAGNVAGSAAGTAISRILAGNGTQADFASILGAAAPGLIGAYASTQQTQAMKDLANQFASYGAPYRQRLSDLYANPSSFLSSQEVQKPVQMGSDILARSLSTNGNPIGSGNALQQLQSYSSDQLFGRLGQEKDRLGGFGGLTAYNAAAPAAATSAVGSNANAYNALGAAASNVFNPPQTLAQSLAAFKTLSGS
jgi:hypothetical protein